MVAGPMGKTRGRQQVRPSKIDGAHASPPQPGLQSCLGLHPLNVTSHASCTVHSCASSCSTCLSGAPSGPLAVDTQQLMARHAAGWMLGACSRHAPPLIILVPNSALTQPCNWLKDCFGLLPAAHTTKICHLRWSSWFFEKWAPFCPANDST